MARVSTHQGLAQGGYQDSEISVSPITPASTPFHHRYPPSNINLQYEDASLAGDVIDVIPIVPHYGDRNQQHGQQLLIDGRYVEGQIRTEVGHALGIDYIQSEHVGMMTMAPNRAEQHNETLDRSEQDIPTKVRAEPISRPSNESIISSWWWWEISAMILSITAMVIFAVLLAWIDNIPLQQWILPITPNSLIAALTTISKASLLIPAASCISQLKWRHFMLNPRKLVDLQVFDDASRGPWGSALLIWRFCFRVRVLVTFGFALVTILALGIETSAQQVIDLPIRESLMTNDSASLGFANRYYSKGFLGDTQYGGPIWKPNSDLLAIQAAIIMGATGTVFQPYFRCPETATRCTWDSLTTLGICADLKNVTDIATPNCLPLANNGNLDCTYSFPGLAAPPYHQEMVVVWNSEGIGGGGPTTTLFQSTFYPGNYGIDGSVGTFLAVAPAGSIYPIGNKPPPAYVFESTFRWCAQTFKGVYALPSGIKGWDAFITEPLSFSTSRVSPISAEDDNNDTQTDDGYSTFTAEPSGAQFAVTNQVLYDLANYLRTLLTATVKHNIYRPNDDASKNVLQIGAALQNSNLSAVISDIAATLTNQMRSNNPGDNLKASTATGRAFFNEPYIHVRWGWAILPFAETTLAAVFLALSIVASRKQPLLKQSLLALLVNRLEGWELVVPPPPPGSGEQTQENLDVWGEGLVVRLEDDGQGRLRFRRKKI